MKKFLIVIFILLICFLGYMYFISNNNVDNKNESIKNDKYSEFSILEDSIFSNYYHKAYDKMMTLSDEEKIGQLFVVRYDKNMVDTWSNNYPSGYVLFAKDFENHNSETIKNELNSIDTNIPLSFMVDEEGGFVTRISRYTSFRNEKFQSPKYYYINGGYELLESIEKEKAQLLLNSGINVNLAPVADISTNPNDFIYNRSFGEDSSKTSEYIKNMVKYANEEGISSCLKHFPGYGNNTDTHTGSAYDKRSYETFETQDYLPFKAGIEEKVPMILISHNVIECIDKDNPASISSIVHKELRDKLKFSGIIITDDLAMGAINGVYDDASVRAVNANNDLIITSDFVSDYNKVLDAYKKGKIKKEVIDLAVTRVIAWKYKYNIM